jgi:hypothetical protein
LRPRIWAEKRTAIKACRIVHCSALDPLE